MWVIIAFMETLYRWRNSQSVLQVMFICVLSIGGLGLLSLSSLPPFISPAWLKIKRFLLFFNFSRPFGCGVILGGYDKDGPQLYMIEPSGISYVSLSTEIDIYLSLKFSVVASFFNLTSTMPCRDILVLQLAKANKLLKRKLFPLILVCFHLVMYMSSSYWSI